MMLIISFMLATGVSSGLIDEDPYIWLEDVHGSKAIKWVEEKNRESLDYISGHPKYQEIYTKNLAIYNSADRIPVPSILGDFIYNFWQDPEHERGIWRRTLREKYLEGNPEWDILLDLDEMSREDGVKWVFKGASGLFPEYSRFMVSLSKGGADATVTREFDVNDKTFVEDGFQLPEAKGAVSWLDENTLFVASDFGEGTVTTSGYPRQLRLWRRGQPASEAPVIFDGKTSDVLISGSVINKPEGQYAIIRRVITFYTSHYYVFNNNGLIKLDIPEDVNLVDILQGQLILELKSDWKSGTKIFRQGSLVSSDYARLLKGEKKVTSILEPGHRSSISLASASRNKLIVSVLENVSSELYSYAFNGDQWTGTRIETPEMGTINIGSVSVFSDEYFFLYQNFLTPSSLYFVNQEGRLKTIYSLPDFFDAEKYQVWQHEAESSDGTKVPYFVLGPKNMEHNGKNPTLLYAYGGFEISMLPSYSAITGNSWLEQGGVYVLANIRGGGEFGPRWHQSGLKENRQRVFDDFHAVAEDLINKRITTGSHLGIQGGSNGGLLVAAAFTQRPELYGAVVCQVPLLDMKRYHKLLAGASWMGEYGNPDIPEEWEYIKKHSPYHNLSEKQDYPPVFFTTSTRDDRVHPGHARKMVAKMQDMGHIVHYYENMEGGHAGASTNEQRAMTSALGFTYLLMNLQR
jgi:prolyl oligopeptidase